MKDTQKSITKQIAFSALFAALCCVSTLVLSIPLPGNGYFNTGDVFVLLSAWFLGPIYGSIAAGIGSALADLLCGYVAYAPATFIIKFFDSLIAYCLWKILKPFIRKDSLDFIPRIISGIIGESFMVLGYFAFESIFFGFAVSVPDVVGNILQGACCLILATLLCAAIRPIKAVKSYFPLLELNIKRQ